MRWLISGSVYAAAAKPVRVPRVGIVWLTRVNFGKGYLLS
jgi:hypothetical protein